MDLVGEVGLGISGGSAEVQGSMNVYLYSMQAFALAIVVHYTASRSARQLYQKLIAGAVLMLGALVDTSYMPVP